MVFHEKKWRQILRGNKIKIKNQRFDLRMLYELVKVWRHTRQNWKKASMDKTGTIIYTYSSKL